MSISSEITRISDNVSGALDAIESKGVTIPTGANSDDLPSLISSIKTGSSVVVTPTLLTGTDIASISVDGDSTTLYAPTPPTPSSATPQALGTASPGSSTDYSRADHVHAKPSYSKSDVGLSNVDNVKQYSASNPPPYPVTSVNGSTGAVSVNAVSSGGTAGQVLTKNSSGYGWADVNELPSGGTAGQFLKKNSATDFDASWAPSGIPYGVCATSAGTAGKTVSIDGVTSLYSGLVILVKFTYSNTAASPSLNVNSLGAKSLYQYGTTAMAGAPETSGWQAGAVLLLTYDGTGWVRNQGYNTNTTDTQGIVRPRQLNGLNDVTLQALVNTNRANRLAFLPADQIIIEKTTDGGTTWVDAEVSDWTKISLFSETRPNVLIPMLNGVKSLLCGLRITITAMKYDVPANTPETQKYSYWNSTYVKSTERYCQLKDMYFWLSSSTDTIGIKAERATGASPNNWAVIFENNSWGMNGWSGCDYINFTQSTFGGGTTQTGNYWNYRFTFMTCGPNGSRTELSTSSTTSQQSIFEIRAYGDTVWVVPNQYMAYDHMYAKDASQNVTFPAKVSAATAASPASVTSNHDLTTKAYVDGKVPTAYTSNPAALGTASPGSSTSWARGDHVHAKPTYSKSDVGLGNVDNVKQYSASNPPPYPVTSVNGSTGAVTVSVPSAATATPSDLGTAAVGTSTKWAKEDHVHKMPSASDVGALPDTTSIPSKTSDLTNDSGYITGMVELSYGSSTWNDFINAYNAKKVVYCRASSNSNPASGSQTRKAFMAYVDNAENPTNVEFQYYRSVNTHTDSQQGDQVYIYKLVKSTGWSVTVREAYSKIATGTGISKSYSNGTITLSSTVSVPTASDATPENLGTAAAGSSANYSRADHVHAMPTASDVGALPSSTVIPSKVSDLTNDSGFVNASGAAAAAPVQSVNGKTGAVTVVEDDHKWNDVALSKSASAGYSGYVPFLADTTSTTASLRQMSTSPSSGRIAIFDSSNYLYSRTPSDNDNSTKVATTAYVDSAIDDLPEPMVFKGSLGTGGTITTLPAASSSNTGFTYKVITAGTYASQAAKVGDTFISDGTAWVLIPSGDEPSGTVTSVGVSNATNGGLSVSGSPITSSGTISIGHSNVLTNAQTTQAVYPIKIDKNGHISAYGSAVSIPSKTSDLTNDSGFITSSSVPVAATATPANLGTAAVGTSTKYAREDHVHTKPTYSKSDVGLGNVDNVKQYSASNPPPYPVTSVNGSTGAVTVSVPSASSTAPANLAATAAVGTGTTWARADHVHKMPSASDVGALPSSTVIPSAATATPANLGTAAVGTSSKYAKEDHVHNYPDVVHVGSTAPTNTNIELWLDSSSGGNSVVSSVDGKTGTVTVLPSGGTAGQVLKKVSGTSYDVTWANESGSVTSVNGQTGDVEISTVAVQDSAPTGGELVWIDTDESGESITIPQIDDNNVSAADTWSSQKIRDFIYPVGSIYMSVNSTSPATIFGGTWEQIQDTFLLSAGSTYTAGNTGGEATHELVESEIPAHTHGKISLTGYLSRAVLDDGNTITRSGIVSSISSPRTSTWKSEGGTACYQVNFDASHTHTSFGGSGSHNNMPPYLVVYMWKRTA